MEFRTLSSSVSFLVLIVMVEWMRLGFDDKKTKTEYHQPYPFSRNLFSMKSVNSAQVVLLSPKEWE